MAVDRVDRWRVARVCAAWPLLLSMSVMMRAPAVHAQQVATLPAHAATMPKITLDVENAPLRTVLKSIGGQANMVASYDAEAVPPSWRVSLHVHDVPADEAFQRALAGTGLVAHMRSAGTVLITPANADVSGGIIVGTVRDAKTRRPILGAKVTLDGATRGQTTDNDGQYRFAGVPAGTHRITIKALGYGAVTHAVDVHDDVSVTVDAVLEAGARVLDQVVVTGMVLPTALKAIPNAITVITAKELEQRGVTSIDQLFHGEVPGVFAPRRDESSGSTPGVTTMAARGSTTLNNALSQMIKTYVDGVELADPTYLGLVDPKSIERIEIITGPQASTIYGSNAINGVMQIFTKRGTTSKPQVTATLQSGFIQNNFSSALAPQHDDALQVSGVDGHVSYNVGGSWIYVGAWTPDIHSATLSGFGGGRLEQGMFTGDVSIRRVRGTNWSANFELQPQSTNEANGTYRVSPYAGIDGGRVNQFSSEQSTVLSLGFTPVSWWTHTATGGVDQRTTGFMVPHPRLATVGDTLLGMSNDDLSRLSLAYTTTLQVPVTTTARAVVAMGVDGWQTLENSVFGSPLKLSGTLNAPYGYSITRQPAHDRGAFVQGQLGIWDAVFLTYGLREEWNPSYGGDANPNMQPRYGIALTQTYGDVTAKFRASYGHATRPPRVGQSEAEVCGAYCIPRFGNILSRFANANLLPEQQSGGEGGLEFYLGNRISLSVSRYNSYVNDLITSAVVDSVDALPELKQSLGLPDWAYSFQQSEYLNLGTVHNDGWELQGSLTTGPVTTKGTYSWNKSRIVGITPKYRYQFSQYPVGAPFRGVPEHTWALDATYGVAGTSISLNVQGQGFMYAPGFDARTSFVYYGRLNSLLPWTTVPSQYVRVTQPYAIADLNVSRQMAAHVEAVFQILNIGNAYRADYSEGAASIGRQTKFGIRARW